MLTFQYYEDLNWLPFLKEKELYNNLYSSSEDEWFIQFVYSFQVWYLKLHYFLEGLAACDSIQVLHYVDVVVLITDIVIVGIPENAKNRLLSNCFPENQWLVT